MWYHGIMCMLLGNPLRENGTGNSGFIFNESRLTLKETNPEVIKV